MTTLAGTVVALPDDARLPVSLTDEHAMSSRGWPICLLGGLPLSPLELIYALRPAAHGHPEPDSFAVLISVVGTGTPIYYRAEDIYTVAALLSGAFDRPPTASIERLWAGVIRDGYPELADLTAAMATAIATAKPPMPTAVLAAVALADPDHHAAYTLTDDEWRLVAAATSAGYLIHPVALDLTTGGSDDPHRS